MISQKMARSILFKFFGNSHCFSVKSEPSIKLLSSKPSTNNLEKLHLKTTVRLFIEKELPKLNNNEPEHVMMFFLILSTKIKCFYQKCFVFSTAYLPMRCLKFMMVFLKLVLTAWRAATPILRPFGPNATHPLDKK